MSIEKNRTANKFISPGMLFAVDVLIVNLVGFFVYLLEHNLDLSVLVRGKLWLAVPISAVCFCVVYYLGRIFKIAWLFSAVRDFLRLGIMITISLCLTLGVMCLVSGCMPLSASGVLLIITLTLLFSGLFKVLVRHKAVKERVARRSKMLRENNGQHDFGATLIVGAGAGGQRLVTEIRTDAFFAECNPVCFVDDNSAKKGYFISGLPVAGSCDDIPELCRKYSIKTVFLAIPSLSQTRRREILKMCVDTGASVHTMPELSEILMNKNSPALVKKVKIEDLLGRDPIKIDLDNIMNYVEGKTVLVTGAGGSIGSELCRQIAKYTPKKLVLFDIYENGVYDVLNEIRRRYPDLDVEALIGSVREFARLEEIFNSRHPDIVYHAAAHKHVPLMEDSPREAVKNNVFGTLNVVRAADLAGVGRFVMISTDKAVNPTNVMGATKRMCEMIVQAWNKKSRTEYVAVRFGNVLGSNGSVIPLFEKQIAAGGPVTVTHPDIIRYFMTIPEAVSLVLQAGASASGGEIFVLDMGEPVKIDDLARNMIRLSGFEPDVDIKVQYTGLRPGEKLYEELLMDEEGLRSTDNKLIHIGRPIEFDEEHFFARLEVLEREIYNENLDVRAAISELVPTFITPEKANSQSPDR